MRLCSQAGWGMESSVVHPLALIIFREEPLNFLGTKVGVISPTEWHHSKCALSSLGMCRVQDSKVLCKD